MLVLNRYFWVEEMKLNGTCDFTADGSRFSTMTVIGGKGSISYHNQAGNRFSEPLFTGDSLLLPAGLASWTITGNMQLISSRPSIFSQDAAWLAAQLEGGDQACCAAADGMPRTGHSMVPPALKRAAGLGQIALEPCPAE